MDDSINIISAKRTPSGRSASARSNAWPAGDIDRAVLEQVSRLFSTPSLLQQVWKTAQNENLELSRADISEALSSMAFVWDDLFPVERNRLVRSLVKEVTVEETGLRIEIQSNGLECAIKELQAGKQ